MHIILVTVGTRGDAQPYVALGANLARRGHRVTVATHEDHRAVVEAEGLAFRPICGSMRALLDSPKGRAWVDSGDKILAYKKAFRALYEPISEGFWRDQIAAVEDADLIVGHFFTVGPALVAEKRKIPYILLCPYPCVVSGEIPMTPFGGVPVVGPWLNRKAWSAFEGVIWAPFIDLYRRVRAELGLPVSSTGRVWQDLRARQTPHLHCFSPAVLSRPGDWPAFAEVTGFCMLDSPPAWKPAPELERFVAGGDAIYVGFGSMTGMNPALLAQTTLAALRRARQRAVIGAGWGSLASIPRGDDVFYVDDVPHDWLFPRLRAVVHHGGAGTLAAGLRAGKPTLVVPFFGDQPLWGKRAQALGVGPPPVPKKALGEARLAEAIRALVTQPSYAERAAALAPILAAEDGTELTARRVLALA